MIRMKIMCMGRRSLMDGRIDDCCIVVVISDGI